MRRYLLAMLLGGLSTAMPVLAAPSPAPSIPDAFITSSAKLLLWTKAGVKSSVVHVDTDDGNVTLYGKLPSEAQKALAAKTAAEVAGVKSVRNLLQVVPAAEAKTTARTDAEVEQLAKKALEGDPALKGSGISVKSVDKGVALLAGAARSYSDQLRAIAVVDRIEGVARVASEVKPPADFREEERITFLTRGAARSNAQRMAGEKVEEVKSSAFDTRISVEVRMRLLAAAQVPSTQISVDTDDGVVTLFGMVPSAEVKTAAGAEAEKVSGVRSVENLLEVVPEAAKAAVQAKDSDIARELNLAFSARRELKSVSPTVKNGAVRLTGSVPTGWDQLHALRLTRNVAGVASVENQLKLDSSR